MFWKPAMTGCGANLISVPSRIRPNSAWNKPPSRMMAKNTSSVAGTLGSPPPATSRCSREYSSRPRKKVVVMRGA